MKKYIQADVNQSTFRFYYKDGNKQLFEAENIYDALSYVLFEQKQYNTNDIYKIEEVEDSITSSTNIHTSYDLPKDDMQWMKGLVWDYDGHEIKIIGVNGYPIYSCKVRATWISEDTWKECQNDSWYAIKIDDRGNLFIQSKKCRDLKLYLNSALNYSELVPDDLNELTSIIDQSDDYDEYDDDNYYTPSSTFRDYSPSNPWDAPGMSIKDFI